MTLPVRFHPLATAELVEAQLWYEDRAPGLGNRLLAAVQGAIAGAAEWPNTGTPVPTDAAGNVQERKVGTTGFPYVVIYRTTDQAIEVLAVYHERRRPFYWAERTR